MTANPHEITITERAAQQISLLREKEGDTDLMLRLTVLGGGCSGFQYKFGFDADLKDDDITFQKDTVTVVTDDVSLEFLKDSTLDFAENLISSTFVINNPNVKTACGCGNSFSVDLE